MSQTESVGSPVTQELVPQGAAGAEPPDAALVNDPSFKCGFHLFDSAGKPWHRPSCTFPCCIVPLSAGSDDSRKWQRTLAAEDSDSVSINLSPPPGPDTRKRLLMDTPPEGWDVYTKPRMKPTKRSPSRRIRSPLRVLARAVSSPRRSHSRLSAGSQSLTISWLGPAAVSHTSAGLRCYRGLLVGSRRHTLVEVAYAAR